VRGDSFRPSLGGSKLRHPNIALCTLGTIVALVPSGAIAAPIFDWSGFYVGASGGTRGLASTMNYLSPPYDPYYSVFSGNGFTGGAFAGFSTRLNEMFVLGIEGQLNVGDTTIWVSDGKYAVQSWDASLQTRLGMPLGGGTMIYGLAGVVTSAFDYNHSPQGWATIDNYQNGTFTGTGGQLGVGLQNQLTPNIFGRLEAVASLYGPHTINYNGSPHATETPSTFAVKAGLGIQLGEQSDMSMVVLSPVPATDWTGFYAGVQGGLTGLTSAEQDTPTPYDHGYWTFTGHGSSGGLFAGYNMSLGDGLVAGVEGELTLGGGRIWWNDNEYAIQNWSAGFKGKIGMPIGNSLVYGLGGIVVSSFDYSDYWSPAKNYTGSEFDAVGAQIGVGVQTELTEDVFGRVELAGTFFAPQTFERFGTAEWDVTPSTITVNVGIGSNF
jgi:hypothetical protein